jgi:hypothetical protein
VKPPLGAVRLVDGIFLGDVYASMDSSFIYLNKITHVINCAGKEIDNQEHFIQTLSGETISNPIKFLTFYWLDDDR